MSDRVDEASMFSLRSKPEPARSASANTFLFAICAVCALLAILPGLASAAPEGGEDDPSPALAFEPSSYDFGQLPVYNNSNQTLQLRNNSAAPIQVYSVDLWAGSGGFWLGPHDCSRTLNPGETCSAQVYFGPNDALAYTAELRAYAESGLVVTVQLSGEGGRPIFTSSSSPVNFGSVPVGSDGVTRTIDVTNTGNMAGGAFIAVISGGAVGSFQLLDENCTGIPLSPAATCNLQVSFQPISTGAKSARLTLFGENDGGTQIMLGGFGLEPEPGAAVGITSTTTGAATARHHRVRRGMRSHRHKRLRLRKAAVAARRAIR
jgi:hypothetical protein